MARVSLATFKEYRVAGGADWLGPGPQYRPRVGTLAIWLFRFLMPVSPCAYPDKRAKDQTLKPDRPEQGVAAAVAGRESRSRSASYEGNAKRSGLVAQRVPWPKR